MTVQPSYFVEHNVRWWDDHTGGREAIESVVTTTYETEYGFFDITAKVVWGIISRKNGGNFNFCRSLQVTAPLLLPVPFGCSLVKYFGPDPKMFADQSTLVMILHNRWKATVTRLVSYTEFCWNTDPDVSSIQNWERKRLQNSLARHIQL